MSRSRPYFVKLPCKVCGQPVSTNGVGRVSHMRRHVREGLVTERYAWFTNHGRLVYDPTDKPNPYKEEMK